MINEEYYTETDYENQSSLSHESINEIEALEETFKKIEKDIWVNIFIPYLNNINCRQILDKLTVNDYYKFYYFMINNNPLCQHIIKKLNRFAH
jgi:hypothetical protein